LTFLDIRLILREFLYWQGIFYVSRHSIGSKK